MRLDPDVQSAHTSRQLLKLIVEPLEAVMREESFPQCIIVVDALDECKDANAILTILSALAEYARRVPPLRFFITSRPVPKVSKGSTIRA
jgi:hypothetical protein